MPRRLRFTREGRVYLLATLGVGAAAVNTGNNLLFMVLGLLLSLIVLSGVLSEVALRKLRVRRRLPRRAFAGTPCLVELEVHNEKARAPSYSIELEDLVEGQATEEGCYFLKVAAGQSETGAYRYDAARRGRLRFTGVSVKTRYPFGLFEKSRELEVVDELVVYPAVAADAPPPLDPGAIGREAPTRRHGPGTEVDGLREYREGDEARAIHWRRTASLGRTVVRDRRVDAARRVTLPVDEGRPRGASAAWDARFEEELSRIAGTSAQALQGGAAVEVCAREASSPLVLPGRAPDPIWRFLALLEAVDPEEDGEPT